MSKLIVVMALLTAACAHDGAQKGAWTMSSMTSPASASVVTTLKRDADGVTGRPPALILRCEGEVVDVYVMGIAATTAETPVVVRLDHDSKPMTWQSSSTHESIFYPGGPAANVAFIRELAASQTLTMELAAGAPATMTFTVAGLERELPAFQKACIDALE